MGRFGFAGRRLAAGVIGVAIVGLAVAGGIAYGTIPDSSGAIHGCYSANGAKVKGGAQLNIVDSDVATCSNGQQAIPWGQTGPAGQTGQTGPTGATGPTGQAGPTDIWDGSHYGGTANLTTKDTQVIVASIAPPAGSFYAEASLVVSNGSSGASFVCTLNVPGTVAYTQTDTTGAGLHAALHLQGVGTLNGSDTITLVCRSNKDNSAVTDWNLDAIKVSTVH
jgi:hypothetical protein